MEYLSILGSIVFPLYSSIWRRWFGGGTPAWFKKLPSGVRRFLLNVVNIGAMFALFFYFRDLNWIWSLYASLALQLIYWNYTFGMYMDIGRWNPTDPDMREEMINDYNEDPVHHIMDWIFDENIRYGQFYDFFGMMLRYSWPIALVFFVPGYNSGLFLLGPLVAFVYEMEFVFKEKNLWQDYRIIREINEYGAGFITGLFLVFNGASKYFHLWA